MTLFSFLFSLALCPSSFAASPAFLPVAESADHCESAVRALTGFWVDCRVENYRSEATEARPALPQAEFEKALTAGGVAVQAKLNAEVKVAEKIYQHKTATLSLPAILPGAVVWFGKDNFAAPRNAATKAKGFHQDYQLKGLACVADGSAYRFQGVEKDGSRAQFALYKGTPQSGEASPLLYIAGTTHNGMTQFAVLCSKLLK